MQAKGANPAGTSDTFRLRAPAFTVWLAPVVLGAGAAWLAYGYWSARVPAQLLARSYSEQRPFEMRIAGAAHTPLAPQKRGAASAFQRPQSLMEAELRIARELAKDPDSRRWLDLRARAEMLGRDPEFAIATLERAMESNADDPELLGDLGMAYALRAEAASRTIDYARACEYLSRALKAKPDLSATTFNRAIVYERLQLVEEAIREWQRYLALDGKGGWSEEARGRLAALESKKRLRRQALDRITTDPAALLRRIESGDAVEPESYLDVLVTEWLPKRWSAPAYDSALRALARLFVEKHRDPWLRDELSASRSDVAVRGLEELAAAAKANRSDDSATALERAPKAAADLRKAGHAAAALFADQEWVYGLHYGNQPGPCSAMAPHVGETASRDRYAWIEAQTLIELSICRGMLGDPGLSYTDVSRALSRGESAGYGELRIRAQAILLSMQANAGNVLVTWDEGRNGLTEFWNGIYPGNRAQQFYISMRRAAENLNLRETAYVFSRAQTLAIDETSHRQMAAVSQMQTGALALEVGRRAEALEQIGKGEAIFGGLRPSKSVRENQIFAEMFRVQAEVANGDVSAALAHLDGLRETAETVDSVSVRLRYRQLLADALAAAGKGREAEDSNRRAVEITEKRMESLREPGERASAAKAAEKAYRGLVAASWGRDQDHSEALRIWEWFRDAEWPGARNLRLDSAALRNETVVSYAELPDGMAAWIFDDRGVHGRRLDVTKPELEKTASRFLRMCADPTASETALREDSRRLYHWLIAPIESNLLANRLLVVETDAATGSVPFAALIDDDGRYLGIRFAIVYSTSTPAYLRKRTLGPVTANSRALVVSNPTLKGEIARGFPPLPNVDAESHAVAGRFTSAVVLAGEDATLEQLERYRPEIEVFHFAGHGFSNSGNGGILLASRKDHSLGAEVLDGRRLAGQDWRRCRLVVLSACSAGTGETKGVVNPESLVRRFLWSGAGRVVASRWSVDSQPGNDLMDAFYSSLSVGEDVPSALRRAAATLRANSSTRHPYYWAGYQTFGSR